MYQSVIIVACVLLHFILSLVFIYCYDTETLWKETDGREPHLYMPRLEHFGEHKIEEQQKYVENVILPAHDYFKKVDEIKKAQDHDIAIMYTFCWGSTFFLFLRFFSSASITDYTILNLIIAVALYALIIFLANWIYKRKHLNLGTFPITALELEEMHKDYVESAGFFFDLQEKDSLNYFIIKEHNRYIDKVYDTIQKRYRIKKVAESILGFLYITFIFEIPSRYK